MRVNTYEMTHVIAYELFQELRRVGRCVARVAERVHHVLYLGLVSRSLAVASISHDHAILVFLLIGHCCRSSYLIMSARWMDEYVRRERWMGMCDEREMDGYVRRERWMDGWVCATREMDGWMSMCEWSDGWVCATGVMDGYVRLQRNEEGKDALCCVVALACDI